MVQVFCLVHVTCFKVRGVGGVCDMCLALGDVSG